MPANRYLCGYVVSGVGSGIPSRVRVRRSRLRGEQPSEGPRRTISFRGVPPADRCGCGLMIDPSFGAGGESLLSRATETNLPPTRSIPRDDRRAAPLREEALEETKQSGEPHPHPCVAVERRYIADRDGHETR
jgi:hypothetical protein